jgi:hypothetical protein
MLIPVRRYLCRACGGTISVLPAELYPRRRYAAVAVLLVLVRHYVLGACAEALRLTFGPRCDDGLYAWSQPRRWGRQLLDRLWGKLGEKLSLRAAAASYAAAKARVERLLEWHGLRGDASEVEVAGLVTRMAAVEFPTQKVSD